MVCKAKVYGAAQHPPEVIKQDENNRFVSDAQINQWTEGTAGQGQFMSMVFRRSATVPATPTGGNWSFPIPDGGLWTNTILPGMDPVFVSTRFFTSNGASPQENVWRSPVLFVQNGWPGPKGETGEAGLPGNPGIQGLPGLDGSNGVNGNDGTSIVWLGESAAHPLNVEDGYSYRNTADKKSYVYWDGAWYQMTIDGFDGRSGLSHAIVSLFKSSPSASIPPAAFSGTFNYTYATGVLSGGTLNGWSQSFPNINMGEYIWVRQASAVSENDTDPIEATEFSAAVVLSGAGMDGLNSATVTLYNKNTSTTVAPVLPTGTFTYSFITYLLTGGIPNGWTKASPTIELGEHLWMIQATASSIIDTDLIEASEFSAPVVIAASGNNGLDIVWKGNLATPPANPVKNWVYRDSDNQVVYIYNGSAWELMVLDGNDGESGANGTDGLSVFITYHDADPQGLPPAPPTNVAGTNNGWHTNPTSAVGWMSQKVDDGTGIGWGLAIPIRGANGNSGPRGSGSFSIDESDPNTPYITAAVADSWAGTLTNASAQAVARDIIDYFADDGSLRPNDKITITDVSNQIAGTRVYTGIATNDYTQIIAANFSPLITEVFDGSVIVKGTLSADRLVADIVAGGELVGGQLVVGYQGIGGDKPPPDANNTKTALESAVTNITSGGLKMTDSVNNNHVQLTPGKLEFVRAGGVKMFEFDGNAVIIRDQNGAVLLQSGGNIDISRVSGVGSLATQNNVSYSTEVTNKPTSLSGINSTEGTKLTGIQTGADKTSLNTSYDTERVGGNTAAQVVRAGNKITPVNASTYIADLAVNTLQIANNAVTVPLSSMTESGLEMTIHDTDNEYLLNSTPNVPLLNIPYIINAEFELYVYVGGTAYGEHQLVLKFNNTTIATSNPTRMEFVSIIGGDGSLSVPIHRFHRKAFVYTPTVGGNFRLYCRRSSGRYSGARKRVLSVIGSTGK